MKILYFIVFTIAACNAKSHEFPYYPHDHPHYAWKCTVNTKEKFFRFNSNDMYFIDGVIHFKTLDGEILKFPNGGYAMGCTDPESEK